MGNKNIGFHRPQTCAIRPEINKGDQPKIPSVIEHLEKQGFEELYTQRLIEGNISRLKLSKLRPHRLGLSRLGLSWSEAGVGGGGQRNYILLHES